MTIDEKILQYQTSKDKKLIEEVIKDYTPFIINKASSVLNRYVNIENDEGYAVALEAFYEASLKYHHEKGSFLTYAQVVIKSRLIDMIRRESKILTLELDENSASLSNVEENTTVMEMKKYEEHLMRYGFDLDFLCDHTPKHEDTKHRAIEIAFISSEDKQIITFMESKFRLPITLISRLCLVSKKVVVTSRYLITATIVALIGEYEVVVEWIKKVSD